MVANVRVAPFPHTCLLTVAGIAAVGFSQRQSQNRVASTYSILRLGSDLHGRRRRPRGIGTILTSVVHTSRRWGALAPQRKTRRFTGDRDNK